MRRIFSVTSKRLLDLLLPEHCAICGLTSPKGICEACQHDYFRNAVNRCRQCAIPLEDSFARVCGQCLLTRPKFDRTIVCTNYLAQVDSLVLGLKFGKNLRYARIIAEQLASRIQPLQQQDQIWPDLLCPVPLSRQRLCTRGFNQSMEMARPLAQALELPICPDLVWRARDTEQQSSLHPEQRVHNVRGAFVINPAEQAQIEGRHIGLVDDVITTGTTLNEIAGLLKRHGAATVTNFIFARTVWR
ncbi:ComF family protein [Undibacterium fentianense]|uniref:ComF family protein n=1 Tax=Undibacterium fentianense TaxID=2828728 RepID=A0A941E8T6_9BURK|nr:ComF family protein [Undibacterium fentianense]MBR7800738.1 ComF family protein [Undibacterium fentianense]